MNRRYEVVYIFDSALEEPAVTEHLTRLHALLGGVEPTVNHWGKRTLAYPIKKKETGYYVVAQFEADTAAMPEYERAMKLDESILRFLVVLEGETPVPPSEARAGAAGEDE